MKNAKTVLGLASVATVCATTGCNIIGLNGVKGTPGKQGGTDWILDGTILGKPISVPLHTKFNDEEIIDYDIDSGAVPNYEYYKDLYDDGATVEVGECVVIDTDYYYGC